MKTNSRFLSLILATGFASSVAVAADADLVTYRAEFEKRGSWELKDDGEKSDFTNFREKVQTKLKEAKVSGADLTEAMTLYGRTVSYEGLKISNSGGQEKVRKERLRGLYMGCHNTFKPYSDKAADFEKDTPTYTALAYWSMVCAGSWVKESPAEEAIKRKADLKAQFDIYVFTEESEKNFLKLKNTDLFDHGYMGGGIKRLLAAFYVNTTFNNIIPAKSEVRIPVGYQYALGAIDAHVVNNDSRDSIEGNEFAVNFSIKADYLVVLDKASTELKEATTGKKKLEDFADELLTDKIKDFDKEKIKTNPKFGPEIAEELKAMKRKLDELTK